MEWHQQGTPRNLPDQGAGPWQSGAADWWGKTVEEEDSLVTVRCNHQLQNKQEGWHFNAEHLFHSSLAQHCMGRTSSQGYNPSAEGLSRNDCLFPFAAAQPRSIVLPQVQIRALVLQHPDWTALNWTELLWVCMKGIAESTQWVYKSG